MATTFQPLLVLSDARIDDELRRAAVVAADVTVYQRRTRRLILTCIGDYLVGLAIIGFSLHMSNGDVAQVVFYLGVLRAIGVPVWTRSEEHTSELQSRF